MHVCVCVCVCVCVVCLWLRLGPCSSVLGLEKYCVTLSASILWILQVLLLIPIVMQLILQVMVADTHCDTVDTASMVFDTHVIQLILQVVVADTHCDTVDTASNGC